jgi:hypothetical protein
MSPITLERDDKPMNDYFETRTREDGTQFVTRKDDAPEWVADLVRDCHDGELPNDWRYETIAAIFDAIADGSDDPGEIADGLVDVYNSDRVAWLANNLNRSSYVDDACDEHFGTSDSGVFGMLGAGQYLAIEQMASQILAAVAENGGE